VCGFNAAAGWHLKRFECEPEWDIDLELLTVLRLLFHIVLQAGTRSALNSSLIGTSTLNC
jgi:hypothetical protein